MTWTRWLILPAFVALLVVPFAFQSSVRSDMPRDAERLIIYTPHNDQIQYEFATAFDRWHAIRFGSRVDVVFNAPGGTSEIRAMLESQFIAALEQGERPGGNADLVFGGGSYEHIVLKNGVSVEIDGEIVSQPISAPIPFEESWLRSIYGENDIGGIELHDPDRHWFGTALSGFGIVYNREVLERIGAAEPTGWEDLCSPDLRGWLALVNPAQSGSVTTAFESIVQRRGWIEGWQILRRAAANARYFSAQSNRPPNDVSQGDAAMGVCIDFYGRYQAQAVSASSGDNRVGYIDPPGETTIDPDPISMLVNAPNPVIARRFIEFTLTDEGQALWQFRATNPTAEATALGPRRFELRRMPIRRSMFADHFDSFIDRVDPYLIAQPVQHPNRAMRSFIPVLFSAMAIDCHEDLEAAWEAIVTHPEYPQVDRIVTESDVSDPELKQMLRVFDALPDVPAPGDTTISISDAGRLSDIRNGWLRSGWADERLWPVQADPQSELRRRFSAFFRSSYRRIIAAASSS